MESSVLSTGLIRKWKKGEIFPKIPLTFPDHVSKIELALKEKEC